MKAMISPWKYVVWKSSAQEENLGVPKILIEKPAAPKTLQFVSCKPSNKEQFQVNWARTDSYPMSTIPYIQRMLNDHVKNQNK